MDSGLEKRDRLSCEGPHGMAAIPPEIGMPSAINPRLSKAGKSLKFSGRAAESRD